MASAVWEREGFFFLSLFFDSYLFFLYRLIMGCCSPLSHVESFQLVVFSTPSTLLHLHKHTQQQQEQNHSALRIIRRLSLRDRELNLWRADVTNPIPGPCSVMTSGGGTRKSDSQRARRPPPKKIFYFLCIEKERETQLMGSCCAG